MPVTSPPAVSVPDVDRIPQRDGSQEQGEYSDNMDYWAGQLPVSLTDFSEALDWAKDTADFTEEKANDAAASATASEVSRQAADAASNYKGEWSSLTGALPKPATVSNDGAFWALANNLANVALSEPALDNPDWVFLNGTRWISQFTGSNTIPANALCSVAATVSTANMAIGPFVANDFLVLAVSPTTTQTVRILNPSCTIYGKGRTVVPGEDITMRRGELAHMRAISSTVLEIYK